MVKISALQKCSKLKDETITSFDVLRDYYETYRSPEGAVIGPPLAEDGSEVPSDVKKDMLVHHADRGVGRVAIIDGARIVVMFEEAGRHDFGPDCGPDFGLQQLNVVLGKRLSDGSVVANGETLHENTTVALDGSVMIGNDSSKADQRSVRDAPSHPDGRLGRLLPDGGKKNGRVFNGLIFDEKLNSWVAAGGDTEEVRALAAALATTDLQKPKSICDLLPKDAFVDVRFEDLVAGRAEKYGVLTYPWSDMSWRDILLKLADSEKGSKLELFWIDIFCVNQALVPEEKMRTIKQTVTIYSNASEHHILGYRTLRRGWCLCELSARKEENESVREMFSAARGITVHTGFKSESTQTQEERTIEEFGIEEYAPAFDTCEFSKETDRPLVARLIIERWVKMGDFNTFLLDLVQAVCPQATLGKHEHRPFARLHKGPQTRSGRKGLLASRGPSVAPDDDIRTAFPEFKKGGRVKHTGEHGTDTSHGEGEITSIGYDKVYDEQQGKATRQGYIRVKFDNGETHDYHVHSLHKLAVVPPQK